MHHQYQTYFEFIRFSLDAERDYSEAFRTMDWEGLLAFCRKQTLTGVCFEGVTRLGKDAGPKGAVLMQWIQAGQTVRMRNLQMNAMTREVCERLRRDGFQTCLLKGQGNALMYPNPLSRTPGDIDVWVCNAAREKVVDYVRKHFENIEPLRYHHIGYEYGSTSVELHFMPATMNCPLHNWRLQRFFRTEATAQSANLAELPDGAGTVAVPTHSFNAVYQLSHLYHHFFDEGIGLRQMVDYYLVVRRLTAAERAALPRRLRKLGLYRFCGAVMYVLHHVLELPEAEMPVPMDERRGRVLLDEILDGGNFGKEYSRYGSFTRQGTAKKYFLKVYRSLHFIALYPAEALSEPLFRTWHWVWRLFHH